ncbi:hypothetical protein SAMN00790413_01412 [Deinococcus hopiensis KR-140]|uniref:Uncharacterized protein n=1 Tax=Deinococcus hopiensis KR-140 TaxID=695939 RepID=A0A1W1VF41_9DEIO|nr:hypothetical protein SAMN00790413_01412 [Deinococcus hopiensis KR-140]
MPRVAPAYAGGNLPAAQQAGEQQGGVPAAADQTLFKGARCDQRSAARRLRTPAPRRSGREVRAPPGRGPERLGATPPAAWQTVQDGCGDCAWCTASGGLHRGPPCFEHGGEWGAARGRAPLTAPFSQRSFKFVCWARSKRSPHLDIWAKEAHATREGCSGAVACQTVFFVFSRGALRWSIFLQAPERAGA